MNLVFVQDEEFGQFLHMEDKIYNDFADIRNEIISETERTSGFNKVRGY